MSKMQVVRALVAERLAAAAEEIFGSVQRMKTQKKKLLTSGLLTRHFNVTSLIYKSQTNVRETLFLDSVTLFSFGKLEQLKKK